MDSISQHQKDLKNFSNQRRWWMLLSCFVTLTVSSIIFKWTYLHQSHILLWSIVSLGLTVSVVWWYWSMRLIKSLLNYRILESKLLFDIYSTIGEIKKDIKNLPK